MILKAIISLPNTMLKDKIFLSDFPNDKLMDTNNHQLYILSINRITKRKNYILQSYFIQGHVIRIHRLLRTNILWLIY